MRKILVWPGLVAVALLGSSPICFNDGARAADIAGPHTVRAHEEFEPKTMPHRHFYVRGDVGIGRNSIGDFAHRDSVFVGWI